MIEISRNCIHLKSLDVSNCNNLTDSSMIEIGRNCIHLESLNTSACCNITDSSRNLFHHVKKFGN